MSVTSFHHYIHKYTLHTAERKEKLNYITAILVLVRARSKARIHGTDIVRPHPTDEARKMVSLLKDIIMSKQVSMTFVSLVNVWLSVAITNTSIYVV